MRLVKTLSNSAFPETTMPYKTFVSKERQLLAVCCSVYTQWWGRSVSVGSLSVLLYDTQSLKLLAYLDALDHEVNDIAFHPNDDVLAIGIGSYDGGALYSGELLVWNYSSGHLLSVLKESRDVTLCSFEYGGTSLRFSVNPEMDFEITQTEYEIPYPVREVLSLEQLTFIREHEEEDFSGDRDSRVARSVSTLSELAASRSVTYAASYNIWDMVFIDADTLIAGRNNAILDVWHLQDGSSTQLPLTEKGMVVEICRHPKQNTLLANVWSMDFSDDHTNALFVVHLIDNSVVELCKCKHSISQSGDGYILARQIDHSRRTVKDFILNPAYLKIAETRLGHYDVFNHHIRVNGATSLYYLAGNPAEGYQNKVLCSISTEDLNSKKVWQAERSPDHYNDYAGTIVGETMVVNRKVYSVSGKTYGTWELVGLDLSTRKIKWVKEIGSQVTSMCEMAEDLVALTDGQVWLVNACNGDMKFMVRESSPTFKTPLSVAVYGNRLAVGLVNGEIELYE